MTITDILALVNAGYTRTEIEAMTNSAPEVPAPAPAPAPVQEEQQTEVPAVVPVAVPAPAPAPAPTPAPAPAPAQETYTNAQIMESIAKLTSAVQANAIAHSVIPSQTNAPTAEDMLAQIIRPTYQQRGD